MDFFVYFNKMTAERRACPGEDLASVIANAKLKGCPLGDLETASYYIIVATAGHDTTSSTIASGLRALIENPDQMAKLKADPALLGPRCRRDAPLGDAGAAFSCAPRWRSASCAARRSRRATRCSFSTSPAIATRRRFPDPFKFRVDREPNRHVAFGYGAHVCLGQHLAKMEAKAFFKELLGRLQSIELAGPSRRIQSTFVTGLKTLPVRYSISG